MEDSLFDFDSGDKPSSFSKKLRGDLRFLHEIHQCSSIIVGLADSSRFLSVNTAIYTLLGWTIEEALAEPISHFQHEDDQVDGLTVQELMDRYGLLFWADRWRHKRGGYRPMIWGRHMEAGPPNLAVVIGWLADRDRSLWEGLRTRQARIEW